MKLNFSTLLILPLGLVSSAQALAAASIEIRNKISKYGVALDTKDFGVLSQIFTDDVVATLPVPNPAVPSTYTGLQALQGVLAASLAGATTQHSMTTTVVDFDGDKKARSTTYLIATYFGTGNLTGQVLQLYGTYQDDWRLGGGGWKSTKRVLTSSPIIGNLAIFAQQLGQQPSPPKIR